MKRKKKMKSVKNMSCFVSLVFALMMAAPASVFAHNDSRGPTPVAGNSTQVGYVCVANSEPNASDDFSFDSDYMTTSEAAVKQAMARCVEGSDSPEACRLANCYYSQ
jgi:hypothetical protein